MFSSKCVIAKAMHEADDAWRESLRKKKLSSIIKEFTSTTESAQLGAIAVWFDKNSTM